MERVQKNVLRNFESMIKQSNINRGNSTMDMRPKQKKRKQMQQIQ